VTQQDKAGRVSEETFDEHLAGEGKLKACEEHAIKELIAEQLAKAMTAQKISKVEMARRMRTSRRQQARIMHRGLARVA